MQNIEFKLNDKLVVDVEIDNIDMADYPDFVDAYISEAKFKDSNKLLSDNELADLQEQNPDSYFEALNDEMLSICDRHYS